jgi:antitoxin HigA-1
MQRRCRRVSAGCHKRKSCAAPPFGLHAPKGDLKGTWAATVRANCRVIFRFETGRRAMSIWSMTTEMGARRHGHEKSAASGELVGDNLEALGVPVTGAVKALGISQQQLHNVIAGRYAISPEMAVRLEKALGSTADTWLGMQMNYDLAQIQAKASSLKVTRLAPA